MADVVPMGGLVSSSSLLKVPGAGGKYPEGTPWWAKLLVQFISVVGIPAAICSFLLWERTTILKDFSNSNNALIKVVEKMVPVLEKLERKVGP